MCIDLIFWDVNYEITVQKMKIRNYINLYKLLITIKWKQVRRTPDGSISDFRCDMGFCVCHFADAGSVPSQSHFQLQSSKGGFHQGTVIFVPV